MRAGDSGRLARWILLCAAAEFLGIAAAAVWYGGMNVAFGEPEPLALRTVAWILMSLAAVPEGIVLGGLQAIGIRWFRPDVPMRKWILATIAVGLLGWAVGTFMPMFLAPGEAGQPMPEPGLAQTAAFAAVFGVAVGAVFGLGQAWALPSKGGGRVGWVVANACGWPARIVIWALGGFGAGASIGIATGIALVSGAQAGGRRS